MDPRRGERPWSSPEARAEQPWSSPQASVGLAPGSWPKLSGWPPVIACFGIALLGSVLHCSPLLGARPWGAALPGLYYIPIVMAAIGLGIRAAIGVALASGLLHAAASAFGCGDPWTLPATETMLYVGVGITAAWLSRTQGRLAAAQQLVSRRNASLENAWQDVQGARQLPALSQIVAGLINRFRTPVSSIEGAVWLLDDLRFPDDKREEFVRIIRKETRQLERALSDIQDFTQPARPKWQRVDFSQLVDQVIQRAGPKEHGPYFLFRKDIGTDLPLLMCDPAQIGKMLLNLLMNSIQAAPGGGQIVIAARRDGDDILIAVQDRGRGIPPSAVGRVFDAFFTTRENGLGLGLTVSRQIVSAHCGTIAIEESSEKGTSVLVRLPLNPPEIHEHRPHSGG